MQPSNDEALPSASATVMPLSLTSPLPSNASAQQRDALQPPSMMALSSNYAIKLPQQQPDQSQAPSVMFFPSSHAASLLASSLPQLQSLPSNLQQQRAAGLSEQTLHLLLQQQLQQQQQFAPSLPLSLHTHPSQGGLGNPTEPQTNTLYLQLEQAVQAQPQSAAQKLAKETQQSLNAQSLQRQAMQTQPLQWQQQTQQLNITGREAHLPVLHQQYHLAMTSNIDPGRFDSNKQPVFLNLHQPDVQPLQQNLDLSYYLNKGQVQLQQGPHQRSAHMSEEEEDEEDSDHKFLDKKDKRRKKNRIAQRNFRSRQRQMLQDSAEEIDALKQRIRELEKIVLEQQLQINRTSQQALQTRNM
jgi:hypothetical protein